MKSIILICAAICIALGVFLGLFVPAAWLAQPDASAPRLSFTIPAHATADQVASGLVDKGVFTNAIGYRIYALLGSSAESPREGTYIVQPGMSYHSLARMFSIGPARDEVELKVLEGWGLHEIADLVGPEGVSPAALSAETGDIVGDAPFNPAWRDDFPFLAALPPAATLEGYLFPDTYRVWKDQLPQSLIRKQLTAFAERAPKIAEEAKAQGRTLNEVVTLASILEKEVTTTKDRKIVAGIFMNRLKDGMLLQSDATVEYLLRSGHTRPTLQDLTINSPYNTYKYKGLPPGPIANPGDDALEAALHPTPSEYRYFLTDADGKVYYANTLEEHSQNRAKAYQ